MTGLTISVGSIQQSIAAQQSEEMDSASVAVAVQSPARESKEGASSTHWDSVSAIAAMISALAAAYTVYQTVKTAKKQREWRRLDRRCAHFMRSVVLPLSELLPKFIELADRCHKKASQEVQALTESGASHTHVSDSVGTAVGGFQEDFFETKAQVNVLLKCWGDADLAGEILGQLEAFEDATTNALYSLCTPNGQRRISEESRLLIGKIDAIVVAYDLKLGEAS